MRPRALGVQSEAGAGTSHTAKRVDTTVTRRPSQMIPVAIKKKKGITRSRIAFSRCEMMH